MSALFTIPIAPVGPHVGGAITCTQPQPKVYLLSWSSPPDNRITTPFCRALVSCLDLLEFGGYEPGVVVTTSAIQKFYSNGLDLGHAVETEGFWALLYEVWARFLTFPMPTVSLMNGHTFAGGFMLAICHDYRLAPSPRGLICLNEIVFGAPLKPAMAAIFRPKIPAAAYRTLVLEAKRFNAQEALAAGLVDAVAEKGLEDALKLIEERGLTEKAKSGVYGTIKAEMYNETLRYLRSPGMDQEEDRFLAVQKREEERREFGKVWVEGWKQENAKAKL